MNDMTPFLGTSLTPDRAKSLLEQAGARHVTIKARKSGTLWAFFSHLGLGHAWSLSKGAADQAFARAIADELKKPT